MFCGWAGGWSVGSPLVPISLRQSPQDDLDAWLLRVQNRAVTYREIGATSASALPVG